VSDRVIITARSIVQHVDHPPEEGAWGGRTELPVHECLPPPSPEPAHLARLAVGVRQLESGLSQGCLSQLTHRVGPTSSASTSWALAHRSINCGDKNRARIRCGGKNKRQRTVLSCTTGPELSAGLRCPRPKPHDLCRTEGVWRWRGGWNCCCKPFSCGGVCKPPPPKVVYIPSI